MHEFSSPCWLCMYACVVVFLSREFQLCLALSVCVCVRLCVCQCVFVSGFVCVSVCLGRTVCVSVLCQYDCFSISLYVCWCLGNFISSLLSLVFVISSSDFVSLCASILSSVFESVCSLFELSVV